MGPFTILKFWSPSLNWCYCAFKKAISLNDDHHLLLLPSCYEGSFPVINLALSVAITQIVYKASRSLGPCVSICNYP